ncbi:MAG: hypothetical protein NTV38_00615, partial [Chloroflexi bacterium]|nr:hypothetical protein [Chloroflexota bacterium]
RKGRKVAYYRLSRMQVATGWRTIIFAVVLVVFALLLDRFGEPASYHFFPPSPSLSQTPTISLTLTISLSPTISLTPTITLTPEVSYTPTATGTPFLPIAIATQFKSIVTPNPGAVFSPLIFSLAVNNFQAINPETVFQNPLTRVFVTYTYDGMTVGAQWTAIWYQNGQLLKSETDTWDARAGTGGSGQYDLALPADQWLPGIYQLVFFVGTEWKILGEFRVMGEPPTATVSPVPSLTLTPTLTLGLTNTLPPSWTQLPTDTHSPSQTPTK